MKTGFTLVEVLVASLILVVAIVAVYSAVLWGKYYTKKNEFVIAASNIGRNEMEEIKAFGVYNADSSHLVPGSNPPQYAIHPRSISSVDSTFETEANRFDLGTTGIVVFECKVYLYGRPTTDPKFGNPILTYQAQMTVGGI